MTRLQSTICNEIDFKLRCIAHFKKVHDKCVSDKAIQRQMLDQTVRADREVFQLVNTDDPKLTKKLGQYADKRTWQLAIGDFVEHAIEEMG